MENSPATQTGDSMENGTSLPTRADPNAGEMGLRMRILLVFAGRNQGCGTH